MTGASPQPPLVETTSTDAIRIVPHAEWDALVARLGGDDAYLRLGWNAASVHLEPSGTVAVLLHHVATNGAELALPLLLRPLPGNGSTGRTGFDATSAYGYGGPIAIGDLDLDAFGAAFDDWARANDVVATFLRFHPLLANHRWSPPRAELVELGPTVVWNVAAGRDLLPAMHTHHRRAVRKADRAGLELRITVAPADLTRFRATYDHTMRRQEAGAFYFFDDVYWDALVETGGGGELVLVDGLLEGEAVASLLLIAHGEWLHYHLGASADAARNIGASNRCFLAAAEWAQSSGIAGFHLGGGVGGGADSPLFVFKHRYDPDSEPRAFHIAKLVHDPDRYRELAGSESTAGFFPPWRAPS